MTGQRFIVNTWLSCDLREAGVSDDVADTINYAHVYAVVREIVEGKPRKLIEAVAEDIAAQLLATFDRLQAVTVEVEKPGAPIPGIFGQVSVKSGAIAHRRRRRRFWHRARCRKTCCQRMRR